MPFTALPARADDAPPAVPAEIVVTASRLDLLGKAQTASQGSVTGVEITLRPKFRPGDLLETVPGLVVTVHSGEGKANQYLLRGFNLDHGTDFASAIDGMPINRATNAHGQGYSDQNFIIPELLAGLDYTKGPYSASVGDFGAVGSARMHLLDVMPTTVSADAGTDGEQRMFGATTIALGADRRLLLAGEAMHFDGPWSPPQHFVKVNLAARFSQGNAADGASLTALYDRSHGNLTTDQPLRAVQSGLIGAYGTLDPSDASRSDRFSLSGHLARRLGDDASLAISAYYIRAGMTLWNDFTHDLFDPVNGDQEQQIERRSTAGGEVAYKRHDTLGAIRSETTFGLQLRHDEAGVSRVHTASRVPLTYCDQVSGSMVAIVAAPGGVCNADDVALLDLGGYGENTTHWLPWLRTTLGVRQEYYHAVDHSLITGFRGRARQWLFQPKGSIAIGPFAGTEFYVSAGRGFHSDDVRGVFGTVPEQALPGTAGTTPLLARADGMEIGLRSDIIRKLQVQIAAFSQDFRSELAYDADIGQDTASAPSRRQGIELSAQYHPARWLELNTDIAFVRARYRGDLAAYGLDGPFIANAPKSTMSFGVLVKDLGPWFGSLAVRNLGPYPLTDGPANPRDKGYTEANLDVGYHLDARTTITVSLFNLLNTHANASAYYYTTRLPGEPAAGVAGYQVHPLEPRAARFAIMRTF